VLLTVPLIAGGYFWYVTRQRRKYPDGHPDDDDWDF
jgi:hypothetical protein